VHRNRLSPEYKTVELESYTEGTVPEHDSVDALLSWLLSDERFDGAVARFSTGPFRSMEWPCIVLSSTEANARRPLLLKSAQVGYSLVIATKTTVEEIVSFSAGVGFTLSGRGRLRGRDDHDPLSGAWDPGALEELIYIASRFSDNQLCLFAHDADPVYVLHR
jgi:hypothetical protein